MIRCQYCDAELEPNATVCPSCGRYLAVQVVPRDETGESDSGERGSDHNEDQDWEVLGGHRPDSSPDRKQSALAWSADGTTLWGTTAFSLSQLTLFVKWPFDTACEVSIISTRES